MHIAIHYNCYFDYINCVWVHIIQYNYNGKHRSVISNETNCGPYTDEHIRDIVFNDMRKIMTIYRKNFPTF